MIYICRLFAVVFVQRAVDLWNNELVSIVSLLYKYRTVTWMSAIQKANMHFEAYMVSREDWHRQRILYHMGVECNRPCWRIRCQSQLSWFSYVCFVEYLILGSKYEYVAWKGNLKIKCYFSTRITSEGSTWRFPNGSGDVYCAWICAFNQFQS